MFWDTSALLPVVVAEAETPKALGWLSLDPLVVAWWGTPIECQSALSRRVREGHLGLSGLEASNNRIQALRDSWLEIQPCEAVRGHAIRLLGRHPLRAADAVQLAAALVWAHDRPTGHRFVTFDAKLAVAARGEGFVVRE